MRTDTCKTSTGIWCKTHKARHWDAPEVTPETEVPTCAHPECPAPASSRVGGSHEGQWTGHLTLVCLNHTSWALSRPIYNGTPGLSVGVLDRRA